MPALHSPKVYITPHADFVLLTQDKHWMDPDFSPGESLNAQLVMLGNLGLNPIFNKVSISTHLARALGSPDLITMSLSLNEYWDGKDAFIAEMAKEKVTVREDNHPYDSETVTLTVSGFDNIFKMGRALRDLYEDVALEVDDLERPVIHPELIGVALEHVDEAAANLPAQTNSFHAGAYRHDWTS